MTEKRGNWVYVEGERGAAPAQVPQGNTRLYAVKLTNLRRDGRVRGGTATIRRLNALFVAIEKRHPGAVQSPASKVPMTVRTRTAGPVVVMVWPLRQPAPIAGTKQ